MRNATSATRTARSRRSVAPITSAAYDPVAKNDPFFGYQNDGTLWSGAMTPSGSAWTSAGTWTMKGTAYRFREDRSFSPDGRTWTWKNEISTDGKTSVPFSHGTVTKQ